MNLLKHTDKLRLKGRAMIGSLQGAVPVVLLAALLAAGLPDPVHADGAGTADPDADAARLVEEVLRKAGGDDSGSLGEWTRSIIDRALGRAGKAARQTVPGSGSGAGPGSPGRSGDPLPAERHAGEFSSPRSGTAEVLIFTSLSVPAAAWRQWAHDAARTGAPLVLRGVGKGGLPVTAKQIGARLDGAEAGVAIDPRLFRLFGVTRVPAVAVVPGGVPPCRSRGCADPGSVSGAGDPAPPHDLVSGNIGLVAALEAVAGEGTVAREAARSHLERLKGEKQR